MAHEIALTGMLGKNGQKIGLPVELKNLSVDLPNIVGLIARSHGMEIRNLFDFLKSISEVEWAFPYSINIVFLMTVLRIADYFQFDISRLSIEGLKLKTFNNPISELEHLSHLSVKFLKTSHNDEETLYVEANPNTSLIYLKLQTLFFDIQHELDLSWAILGEIYGRDPYDNRPNLKYRRIKSNLSTKSSFTNNLQYIAEKISFSADEELPKLLIAPLYGNDPTYGVRELIQNAVDACREREFEETQSGNKPFTSSISVNLTLNGQVSYFEIVDNGRGMNAFDLINYFLKAGASFRQSIEWRKTFVDGEGKSAIQRNGRFGVGVLAAFLLGDEISVATRNKNSPFGLKFSAKVDSSQIEVIKDGNIEIGTKIKIALNERSKELLSEKINFEQDKIRDDYSNPARSEIRFPWTKWFTEKTPKVSYFLNGEILSDPYSHHDPSLKDNEITGRKAIIPKGFDKVVWIYDYLSTPNNLVCNGIVIPDGFSWNADAHGQQLVSPKVVVFDNNGNLDLALNRNSLATRSLQFEEDLVKSIFKNVLFHLLQFTPKGGFHSNKFHTFENGLDHPAVYYERYYSVDVNNLLNLVYLKQGFIIKNDYCLVNLKEENLLWTIVAGPETKEKLAVNWLNVIDIKLLPRETFSTLSGLLEPEKGGRVIVREDIYEKMFNANTKNPRVSRDLKSNHFVEERKKGWVIYTFKYADDKRVDINQLKGLESARIIIQEDIRKEFKDNTVNKLLQYYLGSDPIIPYNIEERRRKFERAFKELS